MIDLHELNVDSLVETYLFANTPAYLFKRLRSNPSVQRMANRYQPAELMEFYQAKAAGRDLDARDIAAGYAALVALAIQASGEAQTSLKQARSPHLPWGPRIIELAAVQTPRVTRQSFNVPSHLTERAAKLVGNTAQRQTITAAAGSQSELVQQ